MEALVNSLVNSFFLAGRLLWELITGEENFKYLFEQLDMCNKKDEYPILKERAEGSGYIAYRFSIPVGLSIDDFEKNRNGIAQFLKAKGKDIKVELVNGQALITVKDELKASYNYEDNLFLNELKIPIGINLLTREMVYWNFTSPDECHILIGGSTGSGKSVALNVILSYLIANRKDIEIYLQDTKNIDLYCFEGAKQVKCCNEGRNHAEETIKGLEDEMERRYKWLKENGKGARNLAECTVKNKPPYIFYAVEELASFNPKEDVEFYRCLQELLAKGRAAGITVCISTQAPYADILPGKIKHNFNTKLCFKTTTSAASEVISGSSDLLTDLRGKGHGYFISSNGTTEIQGFNIQNETIDYIVKKNS